MAGRLAMPLLPTATATRLAGGSLDARPLDLTLEKNFTTFKIQHTALQAIRSFLFEKGFLEVHTPRIIASATEGGAQLF
jgi:aspartyl-tRNA synthetase